MSARHFRHDDTTPSRPAGEDAVSDFCFLEDAQVHVCLRHTPQCQIQSPVTTVTAIIGVKHNQHRPHHRPPSTPTHPRPTDSFFIPSPAALPVCACFPFRRPRPILPLPAFPRRSHLCSRLRSPPFPTLCRSPQNEVIHLTLITGQVALCSGYRGC